MDRNEHYSEAWYQVWRSGGNPDRLRYNESDNDFNRGYEPDLTASREIQRQRKQRQDRIDAWEESGGWED